MHRQLPVRLFACAALAGSASLAVLLPGSIASAKTRKPDKVVCTGFGGSETSQTISGCTGGPAGLTGGTSVPTGYTLTGSTGSGTALITWTDSNTSTEAYTFSEKTGKADKCTAPAGLTNIAEIKEKGTISGGTETALTGGKVKSTICVFSDLSLAGFPGSVGDF